MAYVCPVCEEPQVDATHLANHLAFTAMLHEGDHEDWLDSNASGWAEGDDEALAATLRETLESVEHPIDDTESHDHGADPAVATEAMRDRGPATLDEEAQAMLTEAQELTREMQGDEPETE